MLKLIAEANQMNLFKKPPVEAMELFPSNSMPLKVAYPLLPSIKPF